MPESVPYRIVIDARDIRNITGRRDRAARKMMAVMRKKLGKGPKDLVSIDEFCEYTKLRKNEVEPFMRL